MFIDIRVSPAFYEPINGDINTEEMRHEVLDIHKNGTAPLEHIYNQMNCAHLDKLVLQPIDYSSVTGCPVVTNEEVAELVKMGEGRFIGFASVDPMTDHAAEHLEHAFRDLGLKGLCLHPGRTKLDPSDEMMESLYEICERYGRPVVFHCGLSWEPDTLTKYTLPLVYEPVAYHHPKLRICLTQFGWPYVKETAMLMLKYPNIYTDTGALYADNAMEFYTQMMTRDIPVTWIDRSLRHQVMFGSGNPRFEQIRMADAIGKMGFRDSTLELIRSKNALDFIGHGIGE